MKLRLALVALALLAFPVVRLAAASKPAEVTALEGKAARNDKPLALRDTVGEGDTITTAADSRLELRFSDRSVIRLGENARLQLTAAHFGGGPSKRKLSARLFFGNLWAKVTSVVSGDQKFQVETENAVAGVRGTTFRVDARTDKSVLVRVYAGAVAVAKPVPLGASSPRVERQEVQGPQEVTRDQWEKLVGRQMQVLVAADGTPGEPEKIPANSDDAFARWNEKRDEAAK